MGNTNENKIWHGNSMKEKICGYMKNLWPVFINEQKREGYLSRQQQLIQMYEQNACSLGVNFAKHSVYMDFCSLT